MAATLGRIGTSEGFAIYVQVAVARPLWEPLTYAVPAHMGTVEPGHAVLVPLGNRGAETGYVVGTTDTPSFDPAKIKPIIRLVDPRPAFTPQQLTFFRWIARYYLAPLGMVISTALPSEMKARVLTVAVATDSGLDALTERTASGQEAQVLREVVARPRLTRRGMTRRLNAELSSAQVRSSLDRLVRKGWVEWEEKELSEGKGQVETAALTTSFEEAKARLPRAGKVMLAVLHTLADTPGPMDLSDLRDRLGSSMRPSLNRLVKEGVVALAKRENRDPLSDAPALGSREAPELNADQRAALDVLTAADATGTFLLFGVTGSGKTEVFQGAARAALARKQQVLVLVPEIGLTPQLVGRFRARFGDDVAVLHSGLTGSARLAQWRRIRAGEARVAVGARSALFAPFRHLGLIVVDEEHDDSYKQDEGVTYNARDCAVVLGKMCDCPVVLASATPSLESWHNAAQGRYGLLRLPKRATARPVPVVEKVDLSDLDSPAGQPKPILAPEVITELKQTFGRGGQAIVLYNRRGFATMVECSACGGTWECPNCQITMTLHRGTWRVVCHYCGLKRPYSDTCPTCQAPTLKEIGKGTERVEGWLREVFPSVPTARMDADTTAARGAHERILSAFRDKETQLLVGTQIVAKGHDFPDVQTAVVVSADRGFRMPDFRAAERTWSLLVQMAGRAGRGEMPGRVLVQTWDPDHYVLRHLDNAEGFYSVEMRIRSTLRYPPFSRLCLVRLDGVDKNAVRNAAERLGRDLRGVLRDGHGVDIMGPAPAALPRLVGRYRWQLVIRGTQVRPWRTFIEQHHKRMIDAGERGVRVHTDVDPRHLM